MKSALPHHVRRHSMKNMFWICNNSLERRRWNANVISFERAFELKKHHGHTIKSYIIWGKNCLTAGMHISTNAVWVKYGSIANRSIHFLAKWVSVTQNLGTMRPMLACAPTIDGFFWKQVFVPGVRPDVAQGSRGVCLTPHLINERSFPSFPFRSVPFLRFPSLSFPVLSFPFLSLLTKTLDNIEQSSVRLMTFEPNKPSSMRIPTLAIQTCNGAYYTSKGKPCAHHGKKGRLSNTSFCHQSISRAHYKETTVSKEGTT